MGKPPQTGTSLNREIAKPRSDELSDADLDLVSGGTTSTTSTTTTLSNTLKQISDTGSAIAQNFK
jgi:hypothetical protein